jgi:ComF family protein
LIYVKEPVCKRCGQPIEHERKEYCYDCKSGKHTYAQGKSVWLYKGEMKESIYRFKDGGRREYAIFYARESARIYGKWIRNKGIEAILPIPVHKNKRKKRGYNQAELYARELGKILGIFVDTRSLVRTIDTMPQKELNDKERKNNLKKAFKIETDSVQWKKVLVVDDIYTTGSTADAAANVLKKSGAEEVYILSITIGKGY